MKEVTNRSKMMLAWLKYSMNLNFTYRSYFCVLTFIEIKHSVSRPAVGTRTVLYSTVQNSALQYCAMLFYTV